MLTVVPITITGNDVSSDIGGALSEIKCSVISLRFSITQMPPLNYISTFQLNGSVGADQRD